MSPARTPKRPKGKRARRSTVDALDAAEAKRLLATILEAHPGLLDEVADLADAQLADVTPEDVTDFGGLLTSA